MRLKLLSLSVMALGSAALSSQVLASGYNFGSQSVSAQGTAHANAAEAADPSTIYYNPAGMTELDGTQVTFGVTGVLPDSSFTDTGSTTYTGRRTLTTASVPNHVGSTGSSGFVPDSVFVPNMYLSHKINDQWAVGLGVFVPYGAKLDYGSSWTGRYALESINLQSINFNPSIAFKLDEHHSFGFGVSAQQLRTTLSKAVDVNSALGVTAFRDGQVKMDASGWGYGFNLGYLYKLDDHTRFGLAYRSRIRTTLSGSAIWDYSMTGATGATLAALKSKHGTSAANTTVDTPDSASASFYHDLTDKLAVMGAVTWWGHSAMQNITINFAQSGEGAMVIKQNWKDSWTYSLGMNYKYSDALLLRTGIAYEQSPVPSDNMRHVALPDSDRYWLSLGGNYKFDKHNSVDLAYSYVWFKNANVNYSDVCSSTGPLTCSYTGNGETTNGTFKTHLQMIGLAYNYRF